MEKSGRSSLNGSGRASPDLYPGAGAVMPPVQAGMPPSLLPARSAPVGVNVDFSCSASCGETAACDGEMSSADSKKREMAHRHFQHVMPAKAGIHFPAIALPGHGFPLSRE